MTGPDPLRPLMRSALLALLAFAASAAAQTPPAPAAPAETLNPVGIANAIAFRWADVAPVVPPPDSGAVAEGEGRLVWLAPDAETDRLGRLGSGAGPWTR